MPGIRVDRLLASTAIALLLALPATGTFAGSENGPTSDTSATPRQESQTDNTTQPAASEPAQKASSDTPAVGAKPRVAAPANNSAEKPADAAKPEAKPAASADTGQPGESAKSTV